MKGQKVNWCHVKGCSTSSADAVIYTVHQQKDPVLFNKWAVAVGLDKTLQKVQACQRHFPAGAPTKNHTIPDTKLFNPFPQKIPLQKTESANVKAQKSTTESAPDKQKKKLSTAVHAPLDSFIKLAPNATLINVKKIKQQHDHQKPLRIDKLTFVIDEKDTVKILDYGDKGKSKTIIQKFGRTSIDLNSRVPPINADKKVEHSKFKSQSLGASLNLMRHLKIGCDLTLVDSVRQNSIQVHRVVLIAKSPYFYEELYIRNPKKCTCVLPESLDFGAVEAVISMMYTDSLTDILDKPPAEIQKVIQTFQMKTEHHEFESALAPSSIKQEPEDDKIFLLTPFFNQEDKKEKEGDDRTDSAGRKRRRKASNPLAEGAEPHGRMKVSVQKIVEKALNPFLGKIYELFGSSTNTLHIARSSQHVITLWHSDILLTRLFNQTVLTKFFSEVMTDVFKKGVIDSTNVSQRDSEVYTVETFSPRTSNPEIDESYTDGSTSPWEPTGGSDTSGDSNFIPYYVHLIAVYRFNICVNKIKKSPKESFMSSLLESAVLPEDSCNAVLEDIVDNLEQGLLNETTQTHDCFELVNADLKRKIINDLELHVNQSFHEELIMHVVVDQIDEKGILPFSLAVFLAKGCNFCSKKECKLEDLTATISPSNPVCPNRQCIKRNLQCNICEKQMANSKSLARHKYTVHDIQSGDCSGVYICSHCGEKFSKKWKLNIHERLHQERKMKIACNYCQKICSGATALRKHINLVHETKPRFICDVCRKPFKRRVALAVHKRIHTGEKPFGCMHCDYASETKGNLKAHTLRKHKDQLSFEESDVIQDGVAPLSLHNSGMQTTIVAHSLSDGTFLLTSGNSHQDLVPPNL